MSDKTLEYYVGLPYTLIIKEITDDSGHYYHGTYAELDGCQSTGDTVQELLEGLKEALSGWISVKLDHADRIPEPNEGYNGKVLLRLPKSLHQQLAVKADLEGVSLNQYLVYKLSN